MSLTKLLAAIAIVAFLAPMSGDGAKSQARLINIGTPISTDQMEREKKYLPDVDLTAAKLFTTDFEGLTIIRVESDLACIAEKCLTIVVRRCMKEICPSAKLLAGREVFSGPPQTLDIFGGVRSINFGLPGGSVIVVIFSEEVMIVTSAPSVAIGWT